MAAGERLRTPRGRPFVAIFDAAEIGPAYLPGHGHADTLSLEVSIDGQRLVTNSGTSTYQDDAVRHQGASDCRPRHRRDRRIQLVGSLGELSRRASRPPVRRDHRPHRVRRIPPPRATMATAGCAESRFIAAVFCCRPACCKSRTASREPASTPWWVGFR